MKTLSTAALVLFAATSVASAQTSGLSFLIQTLSGTSTTGTAGALATTGTGGAPVGAAISGAALNTLAGSSTTGSTTGTR